MSEQIVTVIDDVNDDIVITAKEQTRRLTSEATRRRIAQILHRQGTMPIPDGEELEHRNEIDWNIGDGEDGEEG